MWHLLTLKQREIRGGVLRCWWLGVGQHCCCGCPGASAPGHQQLQYWLNVGYSRTVSWKWLLIIRTHMGWRKYEYPYLYRLNTLLVQQLLQRWIFWHLCLRVGLLITIIRERPCPWVITPWTKLAATLEMSNLDIFSWQKRTVNILVLYSMSVMLNLFLEISKFNTFTSSYDASCWNP